MEGNKALTLPSPQLASVYNSRSPAQGLYLPQEPGSYYMVALASMKASKEMNCKRQEGKLGLV